MARSKSIMHMSIEEITESLISGDRVVLGKAITLIESRLPEHQNKSDKLLSKLLQQSSSSLRIAISGAPGVGKSTFIESLGVMLVNEGHKVAVLSIDPSSDQNRGSILGDKTRMEKLSTHDNAFIRPSPAGEFLGGVAWKTREAVTLCEAAGYDIILIETVGVGQSEFKVKHMVDCFVLLLSPGGGDDLQGIKRGIVEIADVLAVTKSDGDLKNAAIRTQKDFSNALHLFPAKATEWTPKVLAISSLENIGIAEVWQTIQSFKEHIQKTGHFEEKRKRQNLQWFKDRLGIGVWNHIETWLKSKEGKHVELEVAQGDKSPIEEANRILRLLINGDQ